MNLHLIQDTVFLNDFADLLSEMGEIQNNHFYVYYSESNDKGVYKHLVKNKFKQTKIIDCHISELPEVAKNYSNVFIHLLSDNLLEFVRQLDKKINLVWCTWGSDFCCPDELFAKSTLDAISFEYYDSSVKRKILSGIEKHKIPFTFRFVYDLVREKYRHSLRIKHAFKMHNEHWNNYLEKKKDVLKRINYLVNYGRDDYSFIEKHYSIKHEYLPFFYTVFDESDNIEGKSKYLESIGVPTDSKKIFIGNCGTIHNNHLDLLPVLKAIKKKHENVAFIVPLSYGDPEYIKMISKIYKENLGSDFYPILDFIEKEEYYRMLNSIDIMLMNHNRNQGGTNLFKAIYYGKKVYIKYKNPLATHLMQNGVKLFNIETDLLDNKDIFEPLSNMEIDENRRAINSVFSKQMAKQGFENILKRINKDKT